VAAAKDLLRVQRQLSQLAGNLQESRSRRQQQQTAAVRQVNLTPGGADVAGKDSSSSSSSIWLGEGSDSEQRAEASHALRALMIEEVGEQVAEQKRLEQQQQQRVL
jgi:hypothetical protein